MNEKRVALVTGANRGLGLETVIRLAKKGIRTYLCCRNEQLGKECAEKLQKNLNLDVIFLRLDVNNPENIKEIVEKIDFEQKRLDILVNNAGILLDKEQKDGSISAQKNLLVATFETNVVAPYLLCEAVLPIMQRQGYGRVVNVSSGMGQLANMQSELPAYRISKTALNAVTKIYSVKYRGSNILVNSVCPGWVQTAMGGPDAPRSLAEGVETIVWAATLEEGGPTGGFFRDKHSIPW